MAISKKQIFGIVLGVAISTVIANYENFLPYRWHTFESPQGSFSVDLPGDPTTETNEVPSADGGSTTIHLVGTKPTNTTAFSCAYTEKESFARDAAEDVLDTARDGSVKGVQGTVVAEQHLMVDGHPARDIQVHARANSLLDARMVLVENRLYMLMVVDTARKNRDAKNVQKFFDSFSLPK